MTRLTYKQFDTKLQNSNIIMNMEGKILLAQIDITNFSYKIALEVDSEVLVEGIAKSKADAKKLVKQALIDQGVAFTAEVRKRETIT